MTDVPPVQTIPLDNGQTLIIRDLSRKISQDAYCVIMEATLTVEVNASLFNDEELCRLPIDTIRNLVGNQVMFEKRTERNFIMAPDKETVFQQLVDAFKSTLLNYLSHGDFPRKLILKEYRDRTKKAPHNAG